MVFSDRAPPAGGERRAWMAVLARCPRTTLEAAWSALKAPPAYGFLRRPEVGLVMLRGRAGGEGAPFNMGEASVTRCVVQLDDGATGVAYVLGRDRRQAELAAVFDALLQDSSRHDAVRRLVVEPAAAEQRQRRRIAAGKTAATRVDFLTMVRGED